MKDFPTIPGSREYVPSDLTWYAFDKLDGSNIRAEWNPKQGWYKFGSRTQLLATNSGFLNESRELVLSSYGDDLAAIFRKQKYLSAVAFFEFYGASSEFGQHNPEEPHKVTLLDVSPYKKGILPPNVFLDLYGHLDIPPVLYKGQIDKEFVASVHQGTLEGITFEGVVCKARTKHKSDVPDMFKVKTRAWLDKLRTYCGTDDALFERLK